LRYQASYIHNSQLAHANKRNCVDGLEQREGYINDDGVGDSTGTVAVAAQE
jgi:hypothetical protein